MKAKYAAIVYENLVSQLSSKNEVKATARPNLLAVPLRLL